MSFRRWYVAAQLDPTFPAHAYVASIQASLVTQLMDPIRLSRMIDNELRVEDRRDAYTVAEMFDTVTEAVWSELGSGSWDEGSPRAVDSFRRTLQRAYVNVAANLLFPSDAPGSGPGVPEDVRSLARWSLTRIDERLGEIEGASGGLDAMTQAHLAETRARIGRALDASVTLSIPRRSF